MSSLPEKWIIFSVIVVIVICIILINVIDTESISVSYNIPEINKFIFSSNWFPSDLSIVKHNNAFQSFESMCLDTLSLDLSTKEHNIDSLGSNSILIENNLMKDFFKLKDRETLIYFVKGMSGHYISKGKLQYLYQLDDEVKEAKYILYCFGNVDWELEDGWTFKKYNENGLHRYYIPENNSIICFNHKDEYELSPLINTKSKYFMVVLIF